MPSDQRIAAKPHRHAEVGNAFTRLFILLTHLRFFSCGDQRKGAAADISAEAANEHADLLGEETIVSQSPVYDALKGLAALHPAVVSTRAARRDRS